MQGQISTECMVTSESRRPFGKPFCVTTDACLSIHNILQRIAVIFVSLLQNGSSFRHCPCQFAMQVITSCNSTQEELSSEFGQSTHGSLAAITSHSTQQSQPQQGDMISQQGNLFQYINHVKTYPKFKFAGVEGTKVCTVAFKKRP